MFTFFLILKEIKASEKSHLIEGLVQNQIAKTSHNYLEEQY